MLHVISWSGGKDSTATVILMKEHLTELIKEGDRVEILFAEVMFDKENNISGHNPEIIDFIYKTSEVFKSWGFGVNILHADTDFLDFFYHRLTRSPDPSRVGLMAGFPVTGGCAIKRDCKLKPIEKWRKAHEEHISYVGIAIDEPTRLDSLHKQANTVSLLEKYNLTEDDARKLCEEYGMLSPQYSLNGGRQARDGCWFCPNAKLCEHKAIKELYPEAWAKYVSLEDIPDLAYPRWNSYSKETLKERDALLKYI